MHTVCSAMQTLAILHWSGFRGFSCQLRVIFVFRERKPVAMAPIQFPTAAPARPGATLRSAPSCVRHTCPAHASHRPGITNPPKTTFIVPRKTSTSPNQTNGSIKKEIPARRRRLAPLRYLQTLVDGPRTATRKTCSLPT